MRTPLVVLLITFSGCAASVCHCRHEAHPSAATILTEIDARTDKIASTIRAIDEAIRIVSDNLSNAETTGFKRTRVYVSDGHPEIRHDFEQGPMENTGRQLDLAIQGNGFFCVKLPPGVGDGHGYVRNGALVQNADGDLVVAINDGYRLEPPFNLPMGITDITVGLDGTVTYKRSGSTTPQQVGRIKLAQFINPEGLETITPAVFQRTDTSGDAVLCDADVNGAGKVLQTFLEGSNVDKVQEQVRLNKLLRWRDDLMELARRL